MAASNLGRQVQIQKSLLRNSREVLFQWFPGSSEDNITGSEFVIENPTRDDQNAGSFKVNVETGRWSEFAEDSEGSQGGDLVALYQYLNPDTDEQSLISDLESQLQDIDGAKVTKAPRLKVVKKEKPAAEPIKEARFNLLPPDVHPDLGAVSRQWAYTDAAGDTLFHILRFDTEKGKETRPVRYITQKQNWSWSYPPAPYPMYSRKSFTDGTNVLFGEGEKVADHLSKQFKGEGFGTTTAMGSGNLFKSDLDPLKKAAMVTMFPDADDAGAKYGSWVLAFCWVHKIPARILNVAALGWKDGEDIADFPDLGWSDLEPHLVDIDDCITAGIFDQKQWDAAIFTAIAYMCDVDYDRASKDVAERLGIGVRTLNSERKKVEIPKLEQPEIEEDEGPFELTPEEKAAERARLWPEIRQILEASNVLDLVPSVLGRCFGQIGEESCAKALYLAMVSRLTTRPASIIVKGGSSGGKSFTSGNVIKLFDDSACISMTGGSAKSLIYMPESFEHKMISIAEATQLNAAQEDDFFSMIVRSLISEKQIVYVVTVKHEETGEMVTQTIKKPGPTGLILTTTAERIHHENETRMFSVFVDESPEQTGRIMAHAAQLAENPIREETAEEEVSLWQKLDTWLTLGDCRVKIPYMSKVIEAVTARPTRFRRDTNTLISFIQASAVLHQVNRDTDDDGFLIATPDDYENVRQLVDPILSRTVEEGVTPRETQIFQCLKDKLVEGPIDKSGAVRISTRQIAETTSIPRQTVGRILKRAVEAEIVVKTDSLPGRTPRLKFGPGFSGTLLNPGMVLPPRSHLEDGPPDI